MSAPLFRPVAMLLLLGSPSAARAGATRCEPIQLASGSGSGDHHLDDAGSHSNTSIENR